jgi:hypothetical protein
VQARIESADLDGDCSVRGTGHGGDVEAQGSITPGGLGPKDRSPLLDADRHLLDGVARLKADEVPTESLRPGSLRYHRCGILR